MIDHDDAFQDAKQYQYEAGRHLETYSASSIGNLARAYLELAVELKKSQEVLSAAAFRASILEGSVSRDFRNRLRDDILTLSKLLKNFVLPPHLRT